MPDVTLSVLSYNVLFGPADGEILKANRRSIEIVNSIMELSNKLTQKIDVICFQEFWDSICEDYGLKTLGEFSRLNGLGNYYRNLFLNRLKKIGFKYKVSLGRQTGKLKGSGLLIVSRYPIISTNKYYFKLLTGEVVSIDSFASKGFLLAKIKKGNFVFNIINTHYQAWVKYYKPRIKSSIKMSKFIKQCIKNLNEPVIICGDLNEDRIHLSKRVNLLYKILNVNVPIREKNSPIYSYNKNNEFVGLDGSNYQFSQAIDYILYSKSHKQPISATTRIIELQSSRKYLANISRYNRKILYTKQLSDHYPILGTFKFNLI